MLTEERYGKILSLLEEQGSVKVTELMQLFDASESTVRRDLNTLDENGKLLKVHGGAILRGTVFHTQDDDVLLRRNMHRDEKAAIAKYAASLITADDFIYLDAGTTTDSMIDFMDVKPSCVVTNAVAHAKRLSELGCEVYIIGGEFKASTEAVVGAEGVECFDKYNFTKGFFGTNGINVEKGYTTPDVKEAMVKKKAMANCRQCYILGDKSKFAQISSVTFAPFASADVITTGLTLESYRKYKNIKEVEE